MLISHYFPINNNAPHPNNSINPPPPPPPRDGHPFCERTKFWEQKKFFVKDSVSRSQKKNDFIRSQEWKNYRFLKMNKKKERFKQTTKRANLKNDRFYWINVFLKRSRKKL